MLIKGVGATIGTEKVSSLRPRCDGAAMMMVIEDATKSMKGIMGDTPNDVATKNPAMEPKKTTLATSVGRSYRLSLGRYPRSINPTFLDMQILHSLFPTKRLVHSCWSQTSPGLSRVKATAFL